MQHAVAVFLLRCLRYKGSTLALHAAEQARRAAGDVRSTSKHVVSAAACLFPVDVAYVLS